MANKTRESVRYILLVLLVTCAMAIARPAAAVGEPMCGFPDPAVEDPQGKPLQLQVGVEPLEDLSGWDPWVVFDSDLGLYRAWYTLYVAPLLGITYAESADGLVWSKSLTAPAHVVPPGESWDAAGPETASVLEKDGTWYLWYTAKPCNRPIGEVGRFKCIGLATSTDNGFTWNKEPGPVMEHTQPWEQPFQYEVVEPGGGPVLYWEGGVQEPTVLWDERAGLFRMWYEGHSQITLPPEIEGGEPFTYPVHRIGYATSTDGRTWDKEDNNPVFSPLPGSWETYNFVGHTNIMADPVAGYHLYYFSAHGIGHAYSSDGIGWQRNPANPMLPARTQGRCLVGEGCASDCTNYWAVGLGISKACGGDGCGGSCGSCEIGELCVKGKCRTTSSCTPDCLDKACGDDGCGGSCGSCPSGQACDQGKMAFGGPRAMYADGGVILYEMRSKTGAKFWGEDGMSLGLAGSECAPAPTAVLPGAGIVTLKPDRLTLKARDVQVAMGAGAGGSQDPTLAGGELRVVTADSDDTYVLGAAGWRLLGPVSSPRGWRYRDAKAVFGPVRNVVLKDGKAIKVKARGVALGHSVATDPEPVAAALHVGTARHCLELGGETRFSSGKYFRAKKAPPATACP